MYNRYIPQPDGTYRRNTVQEPPPCQPPQQRHDPCQEPQHCPSPPRSNAQCKRPQRSYYLENRPGDFLKQLLPKGFDTGDLFVVLLLLLMAGDCEEDRNNALLTLALYFIM